MFVFLLWESKHGLSRHDCEISVSSAMTRKGNPQMIKNRRISAALCYLMSFFLILGACSDICAQNSITATTEFLNARRNGEDWQNAMKRALANTHAWLKFIDPQSQLFPDNTGTRWYTPHNAAADNYPFMMLTSFFMDRPLFEGYMKTFLVKERALTTAENGLPRNYNIETKEFGPPSIFGASEYAKDGLVPVTELLGRSPWFDRMEELITAIMKNAPVKSDYGNLPDEGAEVNGEMLQVLVRLFSATGNRQYLEWALRIGDAYCFEVLPKNFGLPAHTWDFAGHKGEPVFNLRDHGCEILSGLCLLYAVVEEIDASKAESYYESVKGMLDRVMQYAINEDGLFVNMINCETGEKLAVRPGWSDCFGYDYDGFYTFYLATGERKYRDYVEHLLNNIHKYRGYPWEGSSQDGYADAIEGVLNLANRIPVESALDWIESEIRIMFSMQKPEGFIELWHGDGNFSRTALMYALYKSKGLYVHPWRNDVKVGAVVVDGNLYVYAGGDKAWEGTLYFDAARHKTVWNFARNYPRINEFPEWFPVEEENVYRIEEPSEKKVRLMKGEELLKGIQSGFGEGEFIYWIIRED